MDTNEQLPDAPAVKRGGPTTDEGREIVKYNSTVHGFADRRVVIKCLGESEEEYQALVDALLKEYPPESVTQRLLVSDLATNRWRMARALRYESGKIEEKVIQVEKEEKDALRAAEAAVKDATGRLDDAKSVLEIVRSAKREGTFSWELIPNPLWETLLAYLEPRMISLPARELGGVKTPEEVIATIRRELSLDDEKIHAELLRIAEENVASAEESLGETQASPKALEREFALQKDAAALLSEHDAERIHRFTTPLEKERRSILEMLLKFPQLRRQMTAAAAGEIPPPSESGGDLQIGAGPQA